MSKLEWMLGLLMSPLQPFYSWCQLRWPWNLSICDYFQWHHLFFSTAILLEFRLLQFDHTLVSYAGFQALHRFSWLRSWIHCLFISISIEIQTFERFRFVLISGAMLESAEIVMKSVSQNLFWPFLEFRSWQITDLCPLYMPDPLPMLFHHYLVKFEVSILQI